MRLKIEIFLARSNRTVYTVVFFYSYERCGQLREQLQHSLIMLLFLGMLSITLTLRVFMVTVLGVDENCAMKVFVASFAISSNLLMTLSGITSIYGYDTLM